MNLSIFKDYEKYFKKIAKFPEIIMADNKLSQKNLDMMMKLSDTSDLIKDYLVSNGFTSSGSSISINTSEIDEIVNRCQVLRLFDGFALVYDPLNFSHTE